MNLKTRRWVRALTQLMDGPERAKLLGNLHLQDRGLGYDAFGCERESVLLTYYAFRLLYKYYFRVESQGIENIPSEGRALLVSNHSGLLPFDASMISVDTMSQMARPRMVRSIVDFSPFALPYINIFFRRAGQVPGTRRNFAELLEQEQLVLVFPEGARGTTKPFSERYRLRRFNLGFVELALQKRTPIVPMAVVGAEEQAPVLFGSEKLGRAFNLPFVPITPTFPLLGPLGLIPYPVRYTILYGKPISLHDELPPDSALNPAIVKEQAQRLQDTVQALVDEGLRQRGRQPRSGRPAPANPTPEATFAASEPVSDSTTTVTQAASANTILTAPTLDSPHDLRGDATSDQPEKTGDQA